MSSQTLEDILANPGAYATWAAAGFEPDQIAALVDAHVTVEAATYALTQGVTWDELADAARAGCAYIEEFITGAPQECVPMDAWEHEALLGGDALCALSQLHALYEGGHAQAIDWIMGHFGGAIPLRELAQGAMLSCGEGLTADELARAYSVLHYAHLCETELGEVIRRALEFRG